jgi:DNA-binding NarL/FixJ family response regulator
MPIKVLLADDSDVVLAAMRQTLEADPAITIVGAASSFVSAMQMIADFEPDVLLLDLHLPDSRGFSPDLVKSQLVSVPRTLAVSFSNDNEAKALAESYGAELLLDKMNLYSQMIPAIMNVSAVAPKSRIPPPTTFNTKCNGPAA